MFVALLLCFYASALCNKAIFVTDRFIQLELSEHGVLHAFENLAECLSIHERSVDWCPRRVSAVIAVLKASRALQMVPWYTVFHIVVATKPWETSTDLPQYEVLLKGSVKSRQNLCVQLFDFTSQSHRQRESKNFF